MNSPKYRVGDAVLIRRVRGGMPGDVLRDREPEPGHVVKVGRTLVTVQRDRDAKFRWDSTIQCRIETGLEKGDFPSYRIDTPEQLADEERRRGIQERLATANVEVSSTSGYNAVPLSTDALAEILEVVLHDQRSPQ